MLILQNITYTHPNKDLLFENINLTLNQHQKVALIGNNGVGKSTLLRIIAQEIASSDGQLIIESQPYYIPQIFGQFNHLTIAQALGISEKLTAFHEILDGKATESNLLLLDDDWTVEERCKEALAYWQISEFDLSERLENLSGGQKTKVFLAGIAIHKPDLVLLDEPSNHLDTESRNLLYNYISSTSNALLLVSHDRKLLNLLDTVCELTRRGIHTYGGNYDFYASQKQQELAALDHDVKSKEKALRKAKEKERETIERQQKLDARGKKKQEKAGIATIMMNTLRNNAEKSTSKIKNVHTEKIGGISQELQELRKELPDIDKMKFGFDNAKLHRGKVLITADYMNFAYHAQNLWKTNLDFQITSGERIALRGQNGSGKTTLIKLILGELNPQIGKLFRAEINAVYIDQDYSLIDNSLSVYEQAERYNSSELKEHEVKIRLNRFLFTKEDWSKSCSVLSGGERMRLMLCCLTISSHAPDMIILDEPTNNLDIQNIEILTAAINEYQGTLLVVSHDESFLEQVMIESSIQL
ncbi:ribosomal protection-like ABC-F family protein [Algoriphagus winogradskyi]|uniref:ATPase components of ABC transporters with duplicated ATPase domains n=1 Tax=Algoriphagus winogradskyi TaxID=237017 RepID=A0ABY1NKH2_9BACT|nr:ABC-F family ATP-binding cassette domain-containing protein [Algoriphagus winogradskyi]SMP11271.1 ATPase components of ABC transporters with duplicated ATPase domains [Algoriphagus winogradskyi]